MNVINVPAGDEPIRARSVNDEPMTARFAEDQPIRMRPRRKRRSSAFLSLIKNKRVLEARRRMKRSKEFFVCFFYVVIFEENFHIIHLSYITVDALLFDFQGELANKEAYRII